MSDRIKRGPAEIAALLAEHPDLPVLKMGGDDYYGEDRFVLELYAACLGEWWLYDKRIYDCREDAEYAWYGANDGPMPEIPHGECIWIYMDYFDVEDGNE